jgi:hypothetical protein
MAREKYGDYDRLSSLVGGAYSSGTTRYVEGCADESCVRTAEQYKSMRTDMGSVKKAVSVLGS